MRLRLLLLPERMVPKPEHHVAGLSYFRLASDDADSEHYLVVPDRALRQVRTFTHHHDRPQVEPEPRQSGGITPLAL